MEKSFSLGKSVLHPHLLVSLTQNPHPPFDVAQEQWERLGQQRAWLENAIEQGKTIYGVNTGFGYLSDVKIPSEKIRELQVNLIRSHACGVGETLSTDLVRAILLLKAHNFLQGHSGVRETCVRSLLDFLKHDVMPVIPSQGSVGASGDLAPLAHMAMALLGEGEVFYKEQRRSAAEVLQHLGLTSLKPEAKEGLALINGTHFMSVLGSFACVEADHLIETADLAIALSLCAIRGTKAAFDPRIHKLRAHAGQQLSAQRMLKHLQSTENSEYTKVQDPYSFRCAPQVHGMVRMTQEFVSGIMKTELNSITDNPLVCEENVVLSGGNFHGAPLACSFDYLCIALTELGNISERRTEKLTNPAMSGLPSFLMKEQGLHSGFMIPHVVAAALASENKVLSHPSSVDTIPTSADKEDHVSMGAFGARKLRSVAKNVASILAIELIAAAQAMDLQEGLHIPPQLQKCYDRIRSIIPYMDRDRSLSKEIEILARKILSGDFVKGF